MEFLCHTMPRPPPKGLCRARCPSLPMRMGISIRGKRRPRGSVRTGSAGRGGSSSGCRGLGAAYIKGLATAGEEHICAETNGQHSRPRLPPSARQLPTHRLPPRARSSTLRRLRTSSSSWRFGSGTWRVIGVKERGRDVVAIESGGPVPEAAINNRRASLTTKRQFEVGPTRSHELLEARMPSYCT